MAWVAMAMYESAYAATQAKRMIHEYGKSEGRAREQEVVAYSRSGNGKGCMQ